MRNLILAYKTIAVCAVITGACAIEAGGEGQLAPEAKQQASYANPEAMKSAVCTNHAPYLFLATPGSEQDEYITPHRHYEVGNNFTKPFETTTGVDWYVFALAYVGGFCPTLVDDWSKVWCGEVELCYREVTQQELANGYDPRRGSGSNMVFEWLDQGNVTQIGGPR